jgi:hypothetical protein
MPRFSKDRNSPKASSLLKRQYHQEETSTEKKAIKHMANPRKPKNSKRCQNPRYKLEFSASLGVNHSRFVLPLRGGVQILLSRFLAVADVLQFGL